MSNKRFWWSVFAVFVVINVTNFLFHEVWLKDLYLQTAQFWRSPEEIQSWMWLMFLGNFIWSWTFVWIYSKGISKSNPWSQAFRYAWALIGAVQAMLCAFVMTWTYNPQAAWAAKSN
jgi:hypothetical protein